MAITIDELQIEIQAKGAESANGIDALTTSLAALKKMVNKTLTNKLGELSSALDKIKAPITVNMNVKGMEQLKGAVKSATSNVPAGAITPTVDGSAVSGELDKISGSAAQAAGELEQLSSPATKVANELRATGKSAGDAEKKLKEVGASAKQGASGLSKFVSSLKRILMYRVVRSILSNISNAAKEGVQNLVLYSKAIGGIDASRANATMSQFASISMQIKNSLGAALMPVLNSLMPVIQTLANWFIIAANAVNQFFAAISGASMWTKAKEYAVDYAGGLGKAAGAAGDLKNAMLGIDELNVISPPGGGGGGGAGALDYGNMFEEVEIDEKIKSMISWIKDNFNEILAGAIAIGGVLLAWKISKGLIKALEWMSTMKGFSSMFSIGFKIAGLGLFLDAWNTMKEAIHDIMENGANFTNVTKLISGFAEGLGAAFLLFGNIKLAGAALIISGIAGIVSDISDMVNNGVNWENAMSLVKNIGLFVAGIGLAFGSLQLGGIGLMISGVSLIVENFHALVTGFTTGDWGDVNWIEVASGALMLIGGLILAFKTVNTIADVATLGKTTETIQAVTSTTSTLDTTLSTGLSPKLTSLAKNLGMGILIIGEVAIAAGLIVGAIWGLGLLLEQVGIAWQPVIDNGGTVAAAMGLGVGILAVIGVVTALLGSVGTPLIVNIALGTAILAELGIAAGLFLVEIWAIGKGLAEIGKAWQPVLDNGDTIKTGIVTGTALLVGIGTVTALLGAATIATGGLLPAAIGIGTALLVEMAAACVLFTESMVSVATELSDNLAPALSTLNEKLPDLSTNMTNFTTYMSTFADNVVAYSNSTTVAGLQATIDTIIGWFTVDPFQKLSDNVSTMNTRATTLNTNFDLANPALETACTNLGTYTTNIESIATATNVAITWPEEMFSGVKPGMIGDFSYWQVSPVGTKTTDLNTNMDKALPAMASAVLNIASYGVYIAAIALMTSSVISFPDTMFDGVKAETIGTFAGEVSTLYTKTNTLNSNMDLALPALETASTNIATYATDIGALVTAADSEITWPTTMFAEVKSSTITKLTSAVNNMQVETSRLNGKLKLAVPELEKAVGLLRSYTSFLKQMEALCGRGGTVSLSSGVFINMKEVGSKLVTGFVDGIRSKTLDFTNAAKTLIDGFRNTITSYSETCKSSFSAWSANVKNWFISPSYGAINRTTFSNYAKDVIGGFNNGINANYGSVKSVMVTFASAAKNAFTGIMSRNAFYDIAKDVIGGFNNGINANYGSVKSVMVTFASAAKNAFTGIMSRKAFYDIAKDVIGGFNNGINDTYTTSKRPMETWADYMKKVFKAKLDSNSPSKVFERIGEDTVLGYNLGIAAIGKTTKGVVNTWAESFTSVSPVMSFGVDTSALRYYSSDSFAKSVSADVTSNSSVAVSGFKEGMEEFYREYIEPTMSQMAEDMRRQADKKEQTIVQVGNRTVTDAVTTQQNANGYVFAR